MLIFPIASALFALSLLTSMSAVNADTMQRLQCWCRKRASHRDAHNDASYLKVVYHNRRLKYPMVVEHECTKGYCVGLVGEPWVHGKYCTWDRANVNKFCYHRHLWDPDTISVNDEERAVYSGKRGKDHCKRICRRKYGLPVSAGPFAPHSRLENFTLNSMDRYVIKADEGTNTSSPDDSLVENNPKTASILPSSSRPKLPLSTSASASDQP